VQKVMGYDMGLKVKKYWVTSSTVGFDKFHLAKCEIKDKYDIPEKVTIQQPKKVEEEESGYVL